MTISDWAAFALRPLAAVCVPLLLVCVAMSSGFPIAFGAAGLLAVYWTYPTPLTGFRIHDGGNDGLAHVGFARLMLEAALNGKWGDALKGVVPIFYYMPGLRYFRVLERLVFGDSKFGYVAAIAALPIAVFAVSKELMPAGIGFVLAAAFATTAVLQPTSCWASSPSSSLRSKATGHARLSVLPDRPHAWFPH